MNKSVVAVIAAGGLFALLGTWATAGAQPAAPSVAETLAKGKENLERACGNCHAIERPLTKTFDRAGWEKTVERMHDKGAEADKAQRAQIVEYLLTKNVFEAKCSACHGTDRPLGKNKALADWLSTVQRMAGKKPGHLTDAEVAGIAAYLSIVRPLP